MAFFEKIWERLSSRLDNMSEDQCWRWQGAVHGKGGSLYGAMKIKHPVTGDSKVVDVHRISYMVKVKIVDLPKDGREVSHLCGTSLCCNPAHLSFESHEMNNTRQRCHSEGVCFGHQGEPECLFP